MFYWDRPSSPIYRIANENPPLDRMATATKVLHGCMHCHQWQALLGPLNWADGLSINYLPTVVRMEREECKRERSRGNVKLSVGTESLLTVDLSGVANAVALLRRSLPSPSTVVAMRHPCIHTPGTFNLRWLRKQWE